MIDTIREKIPLLPLFTMSGKNDKLRREIFKRARDHVYFLAEELGERTIREYDNLNHAGYYIKDYIAEFGHQAYNESYIVDGKEVSNIIAEIPGKEKDKIILIGAHYDTVEDSPGGDDNASAIAGLLEIYRLLAPYNYRRTIRFVAFTLEEPPHFSTENMGSAVHAAGCHKRNENIELMICLEMIGYGGKERKQRFPFGLEEQYPHITSGDFLCVAALPSSSMYAQLWKNKYNSHSDSKIIDLVAPASLPGMDLSDHRSFVKYEYPAIMLTDTGQYRNKNYHTRDDTAETLNYWFLADNIINIYVTLRELLDVKKFFHNSHNSIER